MRSQKAGEENASKDNVEAKEMPSCLKDLYFINVPVKDACEPTCMALK